MTRGELAHNEREGETVVNEKDVINARVSELLSGRFETPFLPSYRIQGNAFRFFIFLSIGLSFLFFSLDKALSLLIKIPGEWVGTIDRMNRESDQHTTL